MQINLAGEKWKTAPQGGENYSGQGQNILMFGSGMDMIRAPSLLICYVGIPSRLPTKNLVIRGHDDACTYQYCLL